MLPLPAVYSASLPPMSHSHRRTPDFPPPFAVSRRRSLPPFCCMKGLAHTTLKILLDLLFDLCLYLYTENNGYWLAPQRWQSNFFKLFN